MFMDVKTILIGLVVGLLIGAGLGYSVGGSGASALQSQVTALQAQLPTQVSGDWNVVKIFTGSGGETNTEYFYISQTEARLIWNYAEVDYLPYMYVELYKQGNSFRVWASGEISTSQGSNYIHGVTPGNYYLNIDPSSGVGAWTVSIEQYVP